MGLDVPLRGVFIPIPTQLNRFLSGVAKFIPADMGFAYSPANKRFDPQSKGGYDIVSQ